MDSFINLGNVKSREVRKLEFKYKKLRCFCWDCMSEACVDLFFNLLIFVELVV